MHMRIHTHTHTHTHIHSLNSLNTHMHTYTHTHSHTHRSAFMFYSLENRPNIKAQNPEFGVGKLAQRLAQHWKLMNSTQKHPYQLMARKDKERYESELKAYKKGMYTGTGLTARQVAHSVTGRTIPPPATHSNSSSSSRPTSQTSQLPPLASPVDEEGSPPSGDELDQLCEFYQ